MFNMTSHDEMIAKAQIELIDDVVAAVVRVRNFLIATLAKLVPGVSQ